MLDDEPATLELAHERAEELVPTPDGRRLEVVEEREVGAAAPRACTIELGAQRVARRATRPARRPRDSAGRPRGDTLASTGRCPHPAVSARSARTATCRCARGWICSPPTRARRVRPRARCTACATAPATRLSSRMTTTAIDWASFAFAVAGRAYATDYSGAVVLDIGAAQGLLRRIRARVTAHAASSRTSPSRRTSRSSSADGRSATGARRRVARSARAAVDAERRRGRSPRDGRLMGPCARTRRTRSPSTRSASSASRSRHSPTSSRRRPTLARGGALVVKMNIEGAECSAILGTPAERVAGRRRGLRRDAPMGVMRRRRARRTARARRPQPRSERAILRLFACVAKNSPRSGRRTRSHVRLASTVARARAPSDARMPLVAEHVAQRPLERLRVAGLDEPAVLAVDEAVAARDRLRPRHDDRLRRAPSPGAARWSRRSSCCRGRGARRRAPRRAGSASPRTEGRSRPRRSAAARRARARGRAWSRRGTNGSAAPTRPRAGARRRGAGLHRSRRRRRLPVDSPARTRARRRRTERTRRASTRRSDSSHRRSSSASNSLYASTAAHDASERRVQPPHALRAQLRETLGKPDRDVDQRRPHPPRPVQEHQRDADRVDGGEDDVGAIRAPERAEHRREVAAVAARPLERRLQRGAGRARPAGQAVPRARGCATSSSPARRAGRGRRGGSARPTRAGPRARARRAESHGRHGRRRPRAREVR